MDRVQSYSTVQVDQFGNKHWYCNGKLHREDGPAVEWAVGTKEYWIEGRLLTEESFKKRTQENK